MFESKLNMGVVSYSGVPRWTDKFGMLLEPPEQRCGFSSSTKIMQKQGYCKVQGIGLQSTTVLLTSSCPLRRSGS